MATSILVKSVASSIAACAAEYVFASKIGLIAAAGPAGIPGAFGCVIAVNCVASTFTLLGLSFKVGMARSEANVQYPTMYATGTDAKSIKFNCVQRGHQQALETYTSFVVMSLIGGLSHPMFVSVAGITWIIGRWKWAEGYATGDPNARYTSVWSRFIWYSLFAVATASLSTAFRCTTGLF
mmetsp:Transcript_11030/g.32665  ORF Transcript_11030/g.32665 Transcript_11030/m.32665 type:complete len:181 (+) Transcript_11030:92-634(+)